MGDGGYYLSPEPETVWLRLMSKSDSLNLQGIELC